LLFVIKDIVKFCLIELLYFVDIILSIFLLYLTYICTSIFASFIQKYRYFGSHSTIRKVILHVKVSQKINFFVYRVLFLKKIKFEYLLSTYARAQKETRKKEISYSKKDLCVAAKFFCNIRVFLKHQ